MLLHCKFPLPPVGKTGHTDVKSIVVFPKRQKCKRFKTFYLQNLILLIIIIFGIGFFVLYLEILFLPL